MLNINEASKYLNVSKSTLRRWEKEGKIKSFRTPGNHRRYDIIELKKILTINE
jgi:excisionase family DNA binding protein